MLQNAGIVVDVVQADARGRNVRKQAGLLAVVLAVPAVVSLVLRVAKRAQRHDLIYANSQKAFVVGALAAMLTGRKLVWRLRDVLEPAQFGWLLCKLVVLLANFKAGSVIANSKATGQAFVAAGGRARLVLVAYPGFDPAPFDAVTPEEAAAARAALAPGTQKLVGIFGRLSAWKGQMVFVEAIANLPDVVGVIVGGPLFGEEAFEAALRQRIASLGIEDRVRMLGFRRDVPCLMKAMDVIVHASTTPEPFGRVVVEAMLAGRLVVASAAGGVKEILRDGETGYLVEPDSPISITNVLRTAFCSPEKARMVADAGQNWAAANFTLRSMAEVIASEIQTY